MNPALIEIKIRGAVCLDQYVARMNVSEIRGPAAVPHSAPLHLAKTGVKRPGAGYVR
jgi:hypothetical protein